MARVKTWEQPQRTVVRRWREGDITLAELECEHVEPVTGRDLFTWARCQQCNPVMKPRPLPAAAAAGGAPVVSG